MLLHNAVITSHFVKTNRKQQSLSLSAFNIAFL
ncbi:hypothetical protein ABIB50_004027 [Mucilaginibacter sp. UYCu711]